MPILWFCLFQFLPIWSNIIFLIILKKKPAQTIAARPFLEHQELIMSHSISQSHWMHVHSIIKHKTSSLLYFSLVPKYLSD